MKVGKLLNNKNVLYLVVALAILCSLGYVCVSSYECLAVFAVAYFVCCNYIKNRIICLLVALFLSNFLFGCSMSLKGALFEGYSNPSLSPVGNPRIAGKIAEVAAAVAGEQAAEASANQGGSRATQEEEREEAEKNVKKAVTEEFRNL